MKPLIPWHWALRGPGRAVPASHLFRVVNVRGGHADTLRRLIRFGPFGFYVVRYRAGHVDETKYREHAP